MKPAFGILSASALLLMAFCIGGSPAMAQDGQPLSDVDCEPEQAAQIGAICPDDADKVVAAARKKSSVKDFAKEIEGKTEYKGFITFFRDEEKGEVFLALDKSHLEREFIYFSYMQNGSFAGPLRRQGIISDNEIYSFKRRFDRLEVILHPTRFTFDEDSPLARRPDRNNPDTVVASLKIVAETPDEARILVEANDLLAGRGLVQLPRSGITSLIEVFTGPDVLRPSKEKSGVLSIRNYPSNSEIVSQYVFDRPSAASAESSSETITVQHNFIAMPQPGFVPRRDDFRVGFFTERFDNLTRVEGLPYDDLIRRWRLEKKDPEAELSEPVKPITFWIENTTPLEYRETIRQAALLWNRAFEDAGFVNAIQVAVQPDDAPWDAGDIRYNVLQWVSSPGQTFLGYGPSFTNPRTGEILGADIVLEHASIRRTETLTDIWGTASFPATQDEGGGSTSQRGHLHNAECAAAHYTIFGRAAATAKLAVEKGMTIPEAEEELTRQGLYYLVLHEVGHTLGLTHNMMGSYFKAPEALNGPDASDVIVNSVMDYPAVNIARPGQEQGLFFPTTTGPYDKWAIRFGYDPRLESDAARSAHLARSTEPELRFGNDADVLSSGWGGDRGVDPRVQVFDLSNDPIGYAAHQMALVRETLPLLDERLLTDGESYQAFTNAVGALLNLYRSAAVNTSRFIGGIQVERSVVGQNTLQSAPHVPVQGDEQRRAMQQLARDVFAPGALVLDDEILARLQRQRRGFDMIFGRQDANAHVYLRGMAEDVMFQLLNARTLRRLNDTTLYGNDYGVFEMLEDLTDAVFEADLRSDVDTHRRGLQVAYVNNLVRAYGSGRNDAMTEAAMLAQLQRIESDMTDAMRRGNSQTQAHRNYVRKLIRDALDPASGN